MHDIDRSSLPPHPELAAEIARLPGRKLIFTNGSRNHALRTVEQLGLTGLFEDAFDIVAAGLVPKPAMAAYESFFRAHGVEPSQAAMFEDIAKNLKAPRERGNHDREVADLADIDFVTDDLASFLGSVNDARAR